ncbi:MAG: hypothetical protein JWM59_4158 [Verrucomicrobiales bacterium]|nr:hypothetical protein [Verrucomicrobiales bacterium]
MNLFANLLKRQRGCTALLSPMIETPGGAEPSPPRVGVVYKNYPGWGAGIGFYRMFIRSLEMAAGECGIEFGMLADRTDEKTMRSLKQLPGACWGQCVRHGQPDWAETAAAHRLDVIIDLYNSSPWAAGVPVISWIPDFQHIHLPEYFTPEDIAHREKSFAQQAEHSHAVLFSSESAASDYRRLYPAFADKAVVARFPSNLVFETLPSGNPAETAAAYHLPPKFAMVANQFWTHKNHQLVIQAAALAKSAGVTVPVVFTGLPSDYRDPANGPTSRILQEIARNGLSGQVVPLGQIPYADLIQLMRACSLIIQPSRFEGWSTVVQDAKTLGRPLMCSDLDVHREQAPQALGFFGCAAPRELADLLGRFWPDLSEGQGDDTPERLRGHLKSAREYGMVTALTARSAANNRPPAAASTRR